MQRHLSIAILLTLVALALSSCAGIIAPNQATATPIAQREYPTAAPQVQPTEVPPTKALPTQAPEAKAPAAPLTIDMLRNGVYPNEITDSGLITLTDGAFVGEPFVAGSASRPTANLIEPIAMGDLDGDGLDDAALIIAANGGGSGTFVTLEIVLNDMGQPLHRAQVSLGDRAQIEQMDILDGQVIVTAITHGPDDPMCCPTQIEEISIKLGDGASAEVSSRVVGEVAQPPAPLTVDMLRNGVYANEITDSGLITLTDGVFVGEPIVAGSASRPTANLIEPIAMGDLDGDGHDDATLIIAANAGGSGTFITLEAVLNVDGQPTHVATAHLGDRTQIEEITIVDGAILLTAITHGPDDPMCCPMQIEQFTYGLKGDALIELASEVIGHVGVDMAVPDALLDTTWQWIEYIDNGDINNIAVDAPTRYTLAFDATGGVALLLDCNRGTGQATIDSNGSMTFGPIATTMMMCGPDSLDAEYGRLIGDVVGYVIADGRLYLNLKMDAGTMVFVAGGSDDAMGAMLLDKAWQWIEYVDNGDVNNISVDDPTRYTLTLDADGNAAVKLDCNSGFGDYALDGTSLTFGPFGATRMACGPDSLGMQFAQLLSEVASARVDGDMLYLDLKMDAGTMVFALGRPIDLQGQLTGKTWSWLEYIDNGDANNISIVDPSRYTLTLTKEGLVQAQLDCNRGQGGYTLDGANLSFGLMASTLMACPDDSRALEFGQLLSEVVTVRTEGDLMFLDLMMGSGTMVLTSEAQQSVLELPLVGTQWAWRELIDNGEAGDILIEDAHRYTLTLLEDGSAQIQLDCNTGMGQYTVDGASLSFGPIATTRKMCAPDSLEMIYGESLAHVGSYRIEGAKLYLDLAVDGGTMVFVLAPQIDPMP